MRKTIDTYTGERFDWNEEAKYLGFVVPARTTKTRSTHLHPSRVPDKLLRKLNDGRSYDGAR